MQKKIIPIVMIAILFLSACSNNYVQKGVDSYDTKNLEQLSDNYSIEQAKSDKCLIMENGDVTSGQTVFDAFLSATTNKEKAIIRIVKYYTMGDQSQYSEELYEQEKDKFPQIYITDVVFENGIYTTYFYENDGEGLITKTYKYMIKDEFTANPEAIFTTALYYVLVNDENITWDDIFNGMISSQSGASIDHFNVYQKHVYK